MVAGGGADGEGGVGETAVGVAIAGRGLPAVGFDWLPSNIPTIQPTMAAGMRSATRTDRRSILVPGVRWVTNLL
jgi:hypothetical protein